ncbi:MAG: hypothetical protein ACOYNN_09820 [Terrimicrobiaceae bacterium]
MKPFIIYTYDYNPGIGGVKVMHKLCDLLNRSGYQAYLMPIHIREDFYTCSDYVTPVVPQNLLNDIENCIVVYPEGIRYNPLNSKNVIRWILGPSKQEDAQTYSKEDLIYWYMDYYYTDYLGQRENQLMISEFHTDIFTNINTKREGSCYTIRKATPTQLVHPKDSIFIPFNAAGDLIAVANLFNNTEKFYCYDNYTFLSIQAAMCGCTSIVIPDGIKTKSEWLSGSRLSQYGVAYGEEDISRAIETVPLLFKEIENMELEMNRKVVIFAEHCQKYFK